MRRDVRIMSKEEVFRELFGWNLKREEVGVIAAKIRTRLEEKTGSEVQCSWNDKEITILAFVNNSDYKEFVIKADTINDVDIVVDILVAKITDKSWEIKEAEGLFRDFKRFASECECENIGTWGHEVAWEDTELHGLDYYDRYDVYRANDCYAITLFDDLEDIKIVVNFNDDEVRVYDLKTGLEIEDYYEIA